MEIGGHPLLAWVGLVLVMVTMFAPIIVMVRRTGEYQQLHEENQQKILRLMDERLSLTRQRIEIQREGLRTRQSATRG